MSTPRKHWFKVADSILRDPWPRDAKCTAVLLMAWLNQRWARDGLTEEEACHATLSQASLAEITGRSQLKHSVSALRVLGEHASIAISVRGEYVEIHWPKFAEFQQLGSRDRAGTSPRAAPSETQTQDADIRRREEAPKGAKTPPADPPESDQASESEDDMPPDLGAKFYSALGAPEKNPWGLAIEPETVERWYRWKWALSDISTRYKRKNLKLGVRSFWRNARKYDGDLALEKADEWCWLTDNRERMAFLEADRLAYEAEQLSADNPFTLEIIKS